jgi:hypothetical protein
MTGQHLRTNGRSFRRASKEIKTPVSIGKIQITVERPPRYMIRYSSEVTTKGGLQQGWIGHHGVSAKSHSHKECYPYAKSSGRGLNG